MFNSETNEASCECKHFECHGIMCRHQFKAYDVNDVTEVPSKYILRRWRKDVHRRHTRVKVAYHDPTKTEEVKRYDRILTRFDSVCLKAATRPEYVRMAFDAISKLESSLDAAIEKEKETSDGEGFASSSSVNNNGGGQTDEATPTINSCAVGNSSLGNLSAVGLEDISVDLEVAGIDNTPQPRLQTGHIVSQNVSSSVNDGPPIAVPKISVGDPISRKKPHRPRAKRFLSCIEKGGKRSGNKKQQKDAPINTQDTLQDISQVNEAIAEQPQACKPKENEQGSRRIRNQHLLL